MGPDPACVARVASTSNGDGAAAQIQAGSGRIGAKLDRVTGASDQKSGTLSLATETSESGSESSDDEDEYVSKKSVVKKNLASKTIEKEFQSHSIDAILRSKDEPKEKKMLILIRTFVILFFIAMLPIFPQYRSERLASTSAFHSFAKPSYDQLSHRKISF